MVRRGFYGMMLSLEERRYDMYRKYSTMISSCMYYVFLFFSDAAQRSKQRQKNAQTKMRPNAGLWNHATVV